MMDKTTSPKDIPEKAFQSESNNKIVVSGHERKPLERQTIILSGLVAVLTLVLIIISVLFAFGHSSGKHQTVAVKKVSKANASQTTPQKTDAAVLASAMSAFFRSHNGAFPTTISPSGKSAVYVCSGKCSNANASTAELKYYKPSSVKLEQYSSGIKITSPATIYVVTGGGCSSDGQTLGQKNAGSFAVLYAILQNGKLKSQCLSA